MVVITRSSWLCKCNTIFCKTWIFIDDNKTYQKIIYDMYSMELLVALLCPFR